MKDRRQNLYCGPEHKLIPTLEALANYIQTISATADTVTPDNYHDRIKLVRVLASGAMAEVDKLIMIDVQEVTNKKEKSNG